MEGEGKTTVAVNFSAALAKLGSTCLVEADLRQPTVANVFNIEQKAGLADVLNGAISLPDALTHVPGFRDLEVLPCGSIPESPADVLSLPLMSEILETMRTQFDYVVIDSPPVIRFCDARFLSSLADKVVLVGRHGVTTRRAMQRAIELLKDAHASIAGVVLNDVDLSSPDYHYYSYGYSRWKPKRSANGRVAPKTDGDNEPPRAIGASTGK
jgi:capsular exopolysaccharide synthesis family protein